MGAAKPLVQEITHYLGRLSAEQQKAVLTVVKTFAAEQGDWWNEISQEQQAAIDKALKEMKAGKLTPHDEVMKKYKRWMNRK
jgi:predicted transcriptional regulator